VKRAKKRPKLVVGLAAIGSHLTRLREAEGKFQAEVARDAGIGRNTLARIERGEMVPGVRALAALAKRFKVPVESLLEATEARPPRRPGKRPRPKLEGE